MILIWLEMYQFLKVIVGKEISTNINLPYNIIEQLIKPDWAYELLKVKTMAYIEIDIGHTMWLCLMVKI